MRSWTETGLTCDVTIIKTINKTMYIKMLNVNDEFFEHLIQGTIFNITLTEEQLKSKQQFHLQPHEWSHWKQGCECRGTFKRQLFLHIRQISSDAVTNCQVNSSASRRLFTTHNCKATVFNLPATLASNQFGEVISPLLMFIKCYIWAKGLSWKTAGLWWSGMWKRYAGIRWHERAPGLL